MQAEEGILMGVMLLASNAHGQGCSTRLSLIRECAESIA